MSTAQHIATDHLIGTLVDPGSWRPWDIPLTAPAAEDEAYATALATARERTGRDESVLVGAAAIAGVPTAVVASDFEFLGGSMGRDAAMRIVGGVERATSLGLPVIGLPNSGGTRMQEGTPAFLLMIAIAEAILRHRNAGLPYLVYLRHPTTGGVCATWGSLGDVTHAQPDSLVGFLGPRVYEGLTGRRFPQGVQTGENLTRCGVIDGVASPQRWREIAADLLGAWRAGRNRDSAGRPEAVAPAAGDADGHALVHSGWEAVTATRRPDRLGVRDLLALTAEPVELSGNQRGEVAAATVLAVTRVAGIPCVVVGQDRAAQAQGRSVGPGDLRVAQRGIRLAKRWRLPLLLVVDTQGGELSASAESGALAGEIARCLSDLAAVPTPTLSLLLGAGSGGAALALVPADRVVAASDAWISPLPPEGASLISFRTADRADEMANAQHITAAAMHAVGAVDRIIPGPDPDLRATLAVIAEELAALAERPVDISGRADRWLRPAHVVPTSP